MTKNFLISLLTLFILAGCTTANLREELIEAAKRQYPKFPDENSAQLTHFSHVCDLKIGKTLIHVVDQRVVLPGMADPKGINSIVFFNNKQRFLKNIPYGEARPLWCDGPKLYLGGGIEAENKFCESKKSCNVIEASINVSNFNAVEFRSYHRWIYGSNSGAVPMK